MIGACNQDVYFEKQEIVNGHNCKYPVQRFGGHVGTG